MSKYDINKAYVSLYDKVLFEFDANHPKTESQLIEIAKHQRIFYLRDHAKKTEDSEEIWGAF